MHILFFWDSSFLGMSTGILFTPQILQGKKEKKKKESEKKINLTVFLSSGIFRHRIEWPNGLFFSLWFMSVTIMHSEKSALVENLQPSWRRK